MFDTLHDQMKRDEAAAETSGTKALKWTAVAVVSVLLFGALYYAVRLLE